MDKEKALDEIVETVEAVEDEAVTAVEEAAREAEEVEAAAEEAEAAEEAAAEVELEAQEIVADAYDDIDDIEIDIIEDTEYQLKQARRKKLQIAGAAVAAGAVAGILYKVFKKKK